MNIIAKNDNKLSCFFQIGFQFIGRRFFHAQPNVERVRLKVKSFFIIYEAVRKSNYYLWNAYQCDDQ